MDISLSLLKLLIISYGIAFSCDDIFATQTKNKEYKTKFLRTKISRKDGTVYDISQTQMQIPSELIITDGLFKSIVKVRHNPNSVITLSNASGQLSVFHQGMYTGFFAELVPYNSLLIDPLTQAHSSPTIGDYVDIVGLDRISFLFFDGCYNHACNQQCSFCDYHPRRKNEMIFRPSINDISRFNSDFDFWWDSQKENYLRNSLIAIEKILNSYREEHCHLFLMSGNLPSANLTWRIIIETIEFLSKQIDFSKFDTVLNVPPHEHIENLTRLKQLGIQTVQYNIEVTDPFLYRNVCPGKIPYDTFIKKLDEGVQILGKGHVRSNIVFGLQDINKLMPDVTSFSQRGIAIDYSIFQPKPGTELSETHPPSVEDTMLFTKFLANTYMEFNYVPIFCRLSSRSSIINEVYDEAVNKNL